MHNQLIIMSIYATALCLGNYTGLGAIFHGEYETNPAWSKIRNGAFLAWLLIQFLLHYIGRMGEITLADNLAPVLTLAIAGCYLCAITRQEKVPSLGVVVWCLLFLSLCGQTYYAIIHDYIKEIVLIIILELTMISAGMMIAINKLRLLRH